MLVLYIDFVPLQSLGGATCAFPDCIVGCKVDGKYCYMHSQCDLGEVAAAPRSVVTSNSKSEMIHEHCISMLTYNVVAVRATEIALSLAA